MFLAEIWRISPNLEAGLGKCWHFLDFAVPVAKSGIFWENLAKSGIIWQNLEFSSFFFCLSYPFKLNTDFINIS